MSSKGSPLSSAALTTCMQTDICSTVLDGDRMARAIVHVVIIAIVYFLLYPVAAS